jgi:hypothetical protein
MLMLALAALLTASKSELPPDVWRCVNDIEVWCTVDSCAAKAQDETTPMSIWAARDGRFSVCAYTGCWEGVAAVGDIAGRLIWAGDGAEFSSAPGSAATDVTLMIIEKDGAGFVRAGGIASPLLCQRAPLDE